MPALTRPQKITFREMRDSGVRGLLVYFLDYKCSHSIANQRRHVAGRRSVFDIEPRFTCRACGHKGAHVRPDFGWEKKARRATIFRTTHVGPDQTSWDEAWLN